MEKPAGFTVEGSLEMSRAKGTIPTLIQKYIHYNLYCILEAHKNAQALVSNEQRAAPGGDKNCQVADMATINAKSQALTSSISFKMLLLIFYL